MRSAPGVVPKAGCELRRFELHAVLDVHGQRNLEDVIAELQDELHVEAIVGALRLVLSQ